MQPQLAPYELRCPAAARAQQPCLPARLPCCLPACPPASCRRTHPSAWAGRHTAWEGCTAARAPAGAQARPPGTPQRSVMAQLVRHCPPPGEGTQTGVGWLRRTNAAGCRGSGGGSSGAMPAAAPPALKAAPATCRVLVSPAAAEPPHVSRCGQDPLWLLHPTACMMVA